MSLKKRTTTLEAIPKGDEGIFITAERVARMIREGSEDPDVRLKADTLVLSVQHEGGALLDRIFQAAKKYKYSEDHKEVARHYPRISNPKKTEFLRSANFILSQGPRKVRLDCDDFTILIGSLLASLGYNIRLVIIAANPAHPKKFSHIYPEVFYNYKWIPMDALMDLPGQAHPTWTRRTFFKV